VVAVRLQARLGDEAVAGALQHHDFAILADAPEDDLAIADEVHRARTAPGLEHQRAALVASLLA
jgi:hypothetical protein